MSSKTTESREPAASTIKESRPSTESQAGPARAEPGVPTSPTATPSAPAPPHRSFAAQGQPTAGPPGGVYAWHGGSVGPGGMPAWQGQGHGVQRTSWAGAEHFQHPGQDLGYSQAGAMLYGSRDPMGRPAYSNPPSPSTMQAYQQPQHHHHPHHQGQTGPHQPSAQPASSSQSQQQGGARSARVKRSYTGPSYAPPQFNQRPGAVAQPFGAMQPYPSAPYPHAAFQGPPSANRPPQQGQAASMPGHRDSRAQEVEGEAWAQGYGQVYAQPGYPWYGPQSMNTFAPGRGGSMSAFPQQHRGPANYPSAPGPYAMPFAYPMAYPPSAAAAPPPVQNGPGGNGGRSGWNAAGTGSWRTGGVSKPHQPNNGAPAGPSKSSSTGSSGSGPSVARSSSVDATSSPVPTVKGTGSASSGDVTAVARSDISTGMQDASDPALDAGQAPLKGFRQPYHPQQGPRSEHVMWVGNVPADSSVEELWGVFSQLSMEPASSEASPSIAPADSASPLRAPAEGEMAETQDSSPAASLDPATESHGVLSVFIISRSNCAFVNYATQRHLEEAVQYFYGRAVRPNDPRCAKMVCRVRKKEDETQSGVQGQRGRGMHIAWAKDHDRRRREADKAAGLAASSTNPLAGASMALIPRSAPPEPARMAVPVSAPTAASSLSGFSTPRTQTPLAFSVLTSREEGSGESNGATIVEGALTRERAAFQRDSSSTELSGTVSLDGASSGSVSYSSSNSELFRHPAFRERFFILKSLRPDDLERSVETGLWSTQPHNEAVLDRAFRNSETVYLIFSANQSGSFFGYARMAGPIHAPPPPPASTSSATRSSPSPQSVMEENPLDGAIKRSSPSSIAVSGTHGASTTRAGIGGASASGVPSTITEDDEAVGSVSLPPAVPVEEPVLLGPTSTLLGDYPPSQSPQQLTPSSEVPPSPIGAPATWPTAGYGHKPPDFDRRVNTLSPRALVPKELPAEPPKPSGSQGLVPTLTKSRATGDFSPETHLVGLEPEVAAAASDGVHRRDMALVEPAVTPKSTSLPPHRSPTSQATSRALSTSLGPGDSVSVGVESHSQQQLALRAVIHNLRLDEWESMKRANELEKALPAGRAAETDGQAPNEKKDSDGSSITAIATPRAASSDSWGKPFRVEWLQTKPLPFNVAKKLRNPWRDNRQIKVSRDGTEVEPGVGRQLLEEWTRFVHQGEAGAETRVGDTTDEEDEA